MQRWLFLLFLLCFACYKAADPKSAAEPSVMPNDLDALEQQLGLDMQSLGLSTEPQFFLAPTSLTGQSDVALRKETNQDAAGIASGAKGRRSEREKRKTEQSQCQRTCGLVDNICDAAERICQLTAKLPEDPDAPQRCENAKSSCSRAQKRGAPCGCGE